MKKALLVIAGIVVISSMVFAGGNMPHVPTHSDPNSPITISVFHETAGHPRPAANNPIVQYLQQRLNVTFTWDLLVGDIAQRRGTMIAANQYPDLLELRGSYYIENGALINLEPLIDQYGPNIKNHYKDVWDMMRWPGDGGIYYLPNYHVYQGIDHNPNYDGPAFWIQMEVLKWGGYPTIKTVDEYFDLIERYYRANPTINGAPTIPFLFCIDDWRGFELWNPPNFLFGNPNEGNGVVNPVTYEYKTFFTNEWSRQWFEYLNQLDKRGLLDRGSFTDNKDQYDAKISSGRVLGQTMQGWQFMYTPDMVNRDRGQNNRTQVPLPIVFNDSITPRYRSIPTVNLLHGVGISVSARDPIRIIQFFNAFLEQDVQRTINWGIENLHWQWAADGTPYRTQDQRDMWNNVTWQQQNRLMLLGDVTPKVQGSFNDGFPSDLGQYFPEREASLRPENRELLAAYGLNSTNEMMDRNPPPNAPWFPTWSMPNPPDGTPAQIALTRLEQIMKQRLSQMVLAPAADFPRLWNEYVAEMNAAGLATYEAYMQQQLNIRLRDWGIRR